MDLNPRSAVQSIEEPPRVDGLSVITFPGENERKGFQSRVAPNLPKGVGIASTILVYEDTALSESLGKAHFELYGAFESDWRMRAQAGQLRQGETNEPCGIATVINPQGQCIMFVRPENNATLYEQGTNDLIREVNDRIRICGGDKFIPELP
jgi:hypothetical protein